jgi:hypothetical protein
MKLVKKNGHISVIIQYGLICYQLNPYKGSGGNEKLRPHRIPTVGIVQKVLSTRTQLPPQTSPPWWCRLPLLRRGNFGYAQSDAGNLFRRGPTRARSLGLIQIANITV